MTLQQATPPVRRVVRAGRQGRRGAAATRTARAGLAVDGVHSRRVSWHRARCSRCSRSATCTCTARRVSTSARSRSRTRNNAIRRPTSLMQRAAHARRVLRRADDLRSAVPVRLLPRVRRRGRGRHHVAPSARATSGTRPCYVMASANGGHGRWGQAIRWTGHARRVLRVVGPPPGRAAPVRDGRRRRPTDVDVALLYDHFSPMVIMQLEDYGFCRSARAARSSPTATSAGPTARSR